MLNALPPFFPALSYRPRIGSIAIVQDRARDLSYPSWRLTPIYDPDPMIEGVEGMDDGGRLLEDFGESTDRSESSDGRLLFVRACMFVQWLKALSAFSPRSTYCFVLVFLPRESVVVGAVS